MTASPNPERVAIVSGGREFTYRDLTVASDGVARRLLAGRQDLEEGRVAFLVPPGFAYAAILRGIWRAGGVAVPLAVSHPPPELEYVVRDAGAAFVVAATERADPLRAIASDRGATFADADELVAESAAPAPLDAESAPERRALIVYTSGTTGRPKGVVSTHANVSAQIASLVSVWEWSAADRTLLVLPLHHVHGIINVLGCALAAGATCEMAPRFDADLTWARLASGDLTVFTAVPTIYHRLIAAWEAAPPAVRAAWSSGCRSLRLMMSGSAALPVQILERWRQITGHTLLERYGMTELGMALSNPLHGVRRPGSVGAPLPGVTVQLVDEKGEAVPEGSPGELEVRGPSVFLEYWERPEETERAFRDGWFRTGDVAVIEEGAYRLLGRKSTDIIKTGGFKVSALEIEEVLRTHPAIADCAVVGVPDLAWGEKVCAALELRPGTSLDVHALEQWAQPLLAPYKIPRAVQPVEALPRNAMGKVVKPGVVALFQS
jgi:malonyl-CoA/methylmalonyl-CoA synthetase